MFLERADILGLQGITVSNGFPATARRMSAGRWQATDTTSRHIEKTFIDKSFAGINFAEALCHFDVPGVSCPPVKAVIGVGFDNFPHSKLQSFARLPEIADLAPLDDQQDDGVIDLGDAELVESNARRADDV
jgi:hypothetical protein